MPTTFYVIEKTNSDPVEYVSDINSAGLPVFDTNKDNAQWSFSQRVVEDYITDNHLQDVKVKSEGGNHPPKPPISA